MNLSEFDPAGFGFDLNTRELAALIWLGVIGSGLLLWKRTRLGGLSVIRMFFAWPLQRVFLAMTAYTILIVTLLAKLNAWEWSNLKTTVLWWLTVGFASLWEAQRIGEEKHPVRRLLLDALSLTAAITFIAEFGSFPLWAELILPVPLTFIALIVAMAPTLKGGEILVKPLLWILAIAGLGYLAWGTREILAAPFTFLSWNTLREFAAPIILSIAFIPFLFALAVLMTHETIFTSLKIMWKRPDLAAYAQRRALWAFGYDLDGMKRLARDLKMNDIEDRRGVEEAISLIKRLKRREKNPPVTSAELGWSPHDAICFLKEDGVLAKDWHPSFGEWRAEATVVKLGDGFLPDNVSYYLSGTEFAVTRLVLILHASNRNDTAQSDVRFYAMVRALLERAMPSDQAEVMLARLLDQEDVVIREDGWRFAMAWHGWGTPQYGGYSRDFKLSHKAHVATEFDEEFYEAPGPH